MGNYTDLRAEMEGFNALREEVEHVCSLSREAVNGSCSQSREIQRGDGARSPINRESGGRGGSCGQ
jgi:hypothetical protein